MPGTLTQWELFATARNHVAKIMTLPGAESTLASAWLGDGLN